MERKGESQAPGNKAVVNVHMYLHIFLVCLWTWAYSTLHGVCGIQYRKLCSVCVHVCIWVCIYHMGVMSRTCTVCTLTCKLPFYSFCAWNRINSTDELFLVCRWRHRCRFFCGTNCESTSTLGWTGWWPWMSGDWTASLLTRWALGRPCRYVHSWISLSCRMFFLRHMFIYSHWTQPTTVHVQIHTSSMSNGRFAL